MSKSELSFADLASESLIADLRTTLQTSPDLLARIGQELDSDHGFRMANAERALKVWIESGTPAEHFATTFRVLKHCFGFAVDQDKTVDVLLVEMEQTCSQHNIAGFDERRDVLKQLLTPSEQYLLFRKVSPWATRGYQNLVGIEHAVELRAAYDSSKATAPMGLVPLATLGLVTKYADEDNSQKRTIALQLTEEDIDKMLDQLTLAKKRLAELRTQLAGKMTIFDEIMRGAWSDQDAN